MSDSKLLSIILMCYCSAYVCAVILFQSSYIVLKRQSYHFIHLYTVANIQISSLQVIDLIYHVKIKTVHDLTYHHRFERKELIAQDATIILYKNTQ